MKIEFGIACYEGHSADHFETKIRSLVPFLTELLRVQLLETCSKHIYMYPPAPLVSRRTPATSDSASGQYVDDIILARVVYKNPKIRMTELCRLG